MNHGAIHPHIAYSIHIQYQYQAASRSHHTHIFHAHSQRRRLVTRRCTQNFNSSIIFYLLHAVYIVVVIVKYVLWILKCCRWWWWVHRFSVFCLFNSICLYSTSIALNKFCFVCVSVFFQLTFNDIHDYFDTLQTMENLSLGNFILACVREVICSGWLIASNWNYMFSEILVKLHNFYYKLIYAALTTEHTLCI